MKVLQCFLLLSALCLARVHGDEDCVEGEENCSSASEDYSGAEKQNNILVLTDDNFGDIVKGEEMILVTFYAPW